MLFWIEIYLQKQHYFFSDQSNANKNILLIPPQEKLSTNKRFPLQFLSLFCLQKLVCVHTPYIFSVPHTLCSCVYIFR